jgi:hypothetical protein
MIALGLTALFFLAALIALSAIAVAIGHALPQVRALKTALTECPETRELRFTIRELVVTQARGNVVALPVRFKLAVQQPLRAAA